MSYEIITPDGLDGINRAFEIVQEGARRDRRRGDSRTPLDDTTAFEEIGAPDWKYLNFDLSMWDWVGYLDPDFVLSVVNCDQYGGWSDTGYCNPEYDRLYEQQAATADEAKRREIVWRDAGHPLPRQAVHPARRARHDHGALDGVGRASCPARSTRTRSGTSASRTRSGEARGEGATAGALTAVRGADYFLKRTAFALVTVFVAITLNFIIFRAAPGDAVTGLRCQLLHGRVQGRSSARSSAWTSPSGSSTSSTCSRSPRATWAARS